MDENRKKLEELNKKLKSSGFNNNALKFTIATLNRQLAQKNLELVALNKRLNGLNAQVSQLQTFVFVLNEGNELQSKIIAEEMEKINTGYYIVEKAKKLKKSKIINPQGGFIGIGRTAKLAYNFDHSLFTRVDITCLDTIPINGKMKIIRNHPKDSYTLFKANKHEVEYMVVNNPEKFWSASKYLVVAME